MGILGRLLGVKCKHEYDILGKYYRCDVTSYRGRADEVRIYIRLICRQCKEVDDRLLSKVEYRSLLFQSSINDGREEYMKELESRGISNQEQIKEKTIRVQLNLAEENV